MCADFGDVVFYLVFGLLGLAALIGLMWDVPAYIRKLNRR